MPNNFVVKVSNLHKSFPVGDGRVEVLKGIDLKVPQEDFLVIFGPSGCGKSTLLHVLLGLELPDQGTVEILNKDIFQRSQIEHPDEEGGPAADFRTDFRKKHMGMVYQQAYWIRSLTVLENVAFPFQLLGKPKQESLEKAYSTLEMVGMTDHADYMPTELSSGQQQRVNLARALIVNPEILILDEPTGNLDYQAGEKLMRLITGLNDDGKSILMVTHDLEFLRYAKTAARMLEGNIIQRYNSQEKNQLTHQPLHGKRNPDL